MKVTCEDCSSREELFASPDCEGESTSFCVHRDIAGTAPAFLEKIPKWIRHEGRMLSMTDTPAWCPLLTAQEAL